MKIRKAKIQNFKSIKNQDIDFSNFNIIVGKNNCGKTNLFSAIDWFYSGFRKGVSPDEIAFMQEAGLEIFVELEFSGVRDGLEAMANQTNKTKLSNMVGDVDSVVVRRSSFEPRKRFIIIDGEAVSPPTGFDAALNDFLPKFEYVHTRQYHDAVAKFTKTAPIGIMLSEVLNEILEAEDSEYKSFKSEFEKLFNNEDSSIRKEFDRLSLNVKSHLEKQFAECSKVSFEVGEPVFEDLLKNFSTSIDDGLETSVEDKGDGMQRALMLAIIQTFAEYRREKGISKSFLFFIDEAELHLHPSAQRNLKEVLHELSLLNDQIFINTHSSVFLSEISDGQAILRAEKHDKATEYSSVNAAERSGVIYDLLGGQPSDLLLPNNFLIVEGASEYEFISRILSRFYSNKKLPQVVKCNGDVDQAERSINAIEKVFGVLEESIYRERIGLIMDKPSDSKKIAHSEFLNKNKDHVHRGQIYTLPVGSLEECYPEKNDGVGEWRRTSEIVKGMSGRQKVQLAKRVGDAITEDEFSKEMSDIKTAIEFTIAQTF